jgi:hypothetical protein
VTPCIEVPTNTWRVRLATLGAAERAPEFAFLECSPAARQDGWGWPVGPRVSFLDGEGTVLCTGDLPEKTYILPSSYVLRSGDGDERWLAASLVDRTSEMGIEGSKLALMRLPATASVALDGITILPRIPDLLRRCPAATGAFTAYPDFGASPAAVLCYHELRAYSGPETLTVEALVRLSVDGRQELLDLHAAHHTSGPRGHNYLWSADEGGVLRRELNQHHVLWGIEGPSMDMRPSVCADGSRAAYLKEGAVWAVELQTH